MQKTRVWSLIWEHCTCHGATNSMHRNCSALCSQAQELQLLKPAHPTVLQQEKPQWEARASQLESSPWSRQKEKKPAQQQSPRTAKNKTKWIEFFKYSLFNILNSNFKMFTNYTFQFVSVLTTWCRNLTWIWFTCSPVDINCITLAIIFLIFLFANLVLILLVCPYAKTTHSIPGGSTRWLSWAKKIAKMLKS